MIGQKYIGGERHGNQSRGGMETRNRRVCLCWMHAQPHWNGALCTSGIV